MASNQPGRIGQPMRPQVAPQGMRPQGARVQNDFCQSENKNISNKFFMKCNLYNTVFREHIEQLQELYNCTITVENRLLTKSDDHSKICGETFIFKITPNDCNYEIRIVNHTSFKNCDKKQTDELIQFYVNRKDEPNESGFYSCYKIENSQIQHIYQEENLNPSSQDNYEKIVNDFSRTTSVFNPYLFLNSINRQLGLPSINSSMQFYEIKQNIETINLTRLLEQIKRNIIDIERISLVEQVDKIKAIIESFKKCEEIFENPSTKRKYDKKLSSYIPVHHSRVHDKQISIDSISDVYVKKNIYETNYQAKNHIANRLAQYYPDFEFKKSTKSIQKGKEYFNYTYINTIKNILFCPFTATDLFVYKFPRIRIRSDKEGPHINYNRFADQYAQDIFDLKTPGALSRAFDLIEMSKSFIFTFVSTVLNIINNCNNTHRKLEQSGQNDSINETINIPVRIFNVYPELPWVRRDDNTEYLVSSNTLQIKATFNFKKSKDKYTIREYVSSPALDLLNGAIFEKPTIVLPCLEAPYKKFDAIRELEVSNKNKQSERTNVYEEVIQGKNNTDGFESTLLEDGNVRERLRQRLQNHKLGDGKILEIFSEYFLKPFIKSAEEEMKEEPTKPFEFIEAEFPELPGSPEDKRKQMAKIRQDIIDSQRRAAEEARLAKEAKRLEETKLAEARRVEAEKADEARRAAARQADSANWVHNIGEFNKRPISSKHKKGNLKNLEAERTILHREKVRLYQAIKRFVTSIDGENQKTSKPTEIEKKKIQKDFERTSKPLNTKLTQIKEKIKDIYGKNLEDIFFTNRDTEREKILINLKQDLRAYDKLTSEDSSPSYKKIFLIEKILSEIELINIILQEEEIAQNISDSKTGLNRKQEEKPERERNKISYQEIYEGISDGDEEIYEGDGDESEFEIKYLKYKAKYLALKKQYNL